MNAGLGIPSFVEESKLKSLGYRLIAGVDEVGRGALAGPVVAAAVILPDNLNASWLDMVRDSKELTPKSRQYLSDCIHREVLAIGVGVVSHEVIDSEGILQATRLAMRLAVDRLESTPHSLLIDYLDLPEVRLPQRAIVGGDGKCLSIACASIVAKVARDRLMIDLDQIYPGYGLARHKGYGTEEHLSSIRKLGPCPIHRRSFRPIRGYEA